MLRLYVKYTIPDARAKTKKKYFEGLGLKNSIGAVRVVDCYTIDAKLDQKQIQKAKTLLANPLMQETTVGQDRNISFSTRSKTNISRVSDIAPKQFDYAIEIGFLPGVTDNVGATAKETLADGAKIKFKDGQNVYSSQILFIQFASTSPVPRMHSGHSPHIMGRKNLLADASIIADSLYNPLIQRAAIKSFADFKKDGGMDMAAPKVKLKASAKVSKVDLDISDDELVRLGKLGIAESKHPHLASPLKGEETAHRAGFFPSPLGGGLGRGESIERRRGPLALGLEELKVIRDYFNKLGRKPTDVELETLAQTWSEHCKHTIFADPMDELKNGLYKTYIKGATSAIQKQKGRRDFCVSVFSDNAGGIIFDKDWIVSHKVETHNTPSALDPFGGSVTGIVGVNRDILGFGLGAKPIANFYGFCLAEPDDKTELYRSSPAPTLAVGAPTSPSASVGVAKGLDPSRPAPASTRSSLGGRAEADHSQQDTSNKMLSARRIMDGVIAGINTGGNQSGIPTPLGFLYFNSRYRGKPLVFAGTLGLIPKKIGQIKAWEKRAKPGDLIAVVGGRVGADGIHGATFSSESLDSHSPATAVQIGDPITQKKFSDAIAKEARGLNLYNSITDCGAGGLSSAVGEMAGQTNGCEVYLNKVPLKYPGLAPWQIWISESQERMVLAVPKNKWVKFQKLMNSRGVEAVAIGHFTNSGKCVVKHNNKTVLDIDMDFLHNGRPIKQQKTQSPAALSSDGVILRSEADEGSLKQKSISDSSDALGMTPRESRSKIFNLKYSILKLLSRPNIASTEFVSQQYDHEVQGSSVLKPLQGRGKINSESAVIRPVLNSKKALVLSYGLHPSFSEPSPYNMAACGIDSAVRAAVAAGADIDYLALLDNFCWCSPEDPHRLWQLKETARACYDTAVAYGTPFISGKDSMHNDFKGFSGDGQPLKISIPPTLLISALGVIPDADKAVSLDAKLPGDLLYILGTTDDELGGSEYAEMINPFQSPLQQNGEGFTDTSDSRGAPPSFLKRGLGGVPAVNAPKNYLLYKALYYANQQNLIASAISINSGGLAVALVKTLMGGGLGAEINLAVIPGDWKENYQALFSESQGRILVSVAPQNYKKFEKLMEKNSFAKIGKIIAKPVLTITDKSSRVIVNLKIVDALKTYKSTFKEF